jgi:hypothetical protein
MREREKKKEKNAKEMNAGMLRFGLVYGAHQKRVPEEQQACKSRQSLVTCDRSSLASASGFWTRSISLVLQHKE